MENNKSERGVRELFGYTLKNVKDGERILTYMEKLAAERDILEERQQHLTSLTRLFEKAIYDADDLAAQIKKEAEEQARTEAGAILSQADEKIEQSNQVVAPIRKDASQKGAQAPILDRHWNGQGLLATPDGIWDDLSGAPGVRQLSLAQQRFVDDPINGHVLYRDKCIARLDRRRQA